MTDRTRAEQIVHQVRAHSSPTARVEVVLAALAEEREAEQQRFLRIVEAVEPLDPAAAATILASVPWKRNPDPPQRTLPEQIRSLLLCSSHERMMERVAEMIDEEREKCALLAEEEGCFVVARAIRGRGGEND